MRPSARRTAGTQAFALMTDHAHDEAIAADRLSIEKRADGTIVVAVEGAGPRAATLPAARFSFREGDPQYAYWVRRFDAQSRSPAPAADGGPARQAGG